MKNVKLFGKSVPILALAIVLMVSVAGVSAAIVSYLSQKATVTATVKSPIVVKGDIYRMKNQAAIDAIISSTDRLVELQDPDDYGWDWIVTGLEEHSEASSPTNLYGVTGLGLIDAYSLQGDMDYYLAAKGVAEHIIQAPLESEDFYRGATKRIPSFDYRFLLSFSGISGDPSYSEYALTNWETQKNDYEFGTAEEAWTLLMGHYGVVGFAMWQAADYGIAAHKMEDGDWANDMAAVVEEKLALIVPEEEEGEILGWSKALEFFSIIGGHDDTVTALINLLGDAQYSDGHWDGLQSEGSVQDTAYAVMALKAAGKTTLAERGSGWLIVDQLDNGGWLTEDDEYAEVDSEALQAIMDTTTTETTHYTFDTSASGIVDIETISGGDTILITETATNSANNPVTAIVTFVIPEADGWSDGWTETGAEMDVYWRYPGETHWNEMPLDSGWAITTDLENAVILVRGSFVSDIVKAETGSTIPPVGSMTVEIRINFAQSVEPGFYTLNILAVNPETELSVIPDLSP